MPSFKLSAHGPSTIPFCPHYFETNSRYITSFIKFQIVCLKELFKIIITIPLAYLKSNKIFNVIKYKVKFSNFADCLRNFFILYESNLDPNIVVS